MSVRSFLRSCDASIGPLIGKILVRIYKEKKQKEKTTSKKIVFIKLWAIGESVLTLPALRALSESLPNSKITVLTTSYAADVFRNQPFIANVDIVALNPLSYVWYLIRHAQTFDISIDGEPYLFASACTARILGRERVGFATCGRDFLYDKQVVYNDQQHVMRTYSDLVRAVSTSSEYLSELVPLPYTTQDTDIVQKLLTKKGINPDQDFIVLCPTVGGSAKGRMWPLDRFVSVANTLSKDHSMPIIFLGSKHDETLLRKLQMQTREKSTAVSCLTLPQAAYLLERARLCIANDSGPMHVSAAMNTPTLGLFGPNTPVRFAPLNSRSKWLYNPCPLSPHINVHRGEISDISCNCMENIAISEVVRVATEMLKGYDENL